MSEPTTDPQIGFRVREQEDKERFGEALAKQSHIANATSFFQSCMEALCEASDNDEIVTMPLRFETRKKQPPGS